MVSLSVAERKSFSKDKRIEDCLMFDKYMGAEDDETFTNDSRKVR